MELITYDAQNSASRRSEDPIVSFCKSGLITFNSAAVEKLLLKKETQVAFHQDKRKKTDWYLEKRTMNGFVLRQNKSAKSLSLCFNCPRLAKEVMASLNKTDHVKIPLAMVPTDGKYYSLLTGAL